MELWRGSEQLHLQETISPGKEPAPPAAGPSEAGRGERDGELRTPASALPSEQRDQSGNHMKRGGKSLFLSNNKEFL